LTCSGSRFGRSLAAIIGIAVLSGLASTIDFPLQIPGYRMTLTNDIDATRRSLFPGKNDGQATATWIETKSI
jgi:hypothetical protein